MNLQPVLEKIKSLNNELTQENNPSVLSNDELKVLEGIISKTEQKSHYHVVNFTEKEYELLDKILENWPKKKIFSILDLMRLMVLHPIAVRRFTLVSELKKIVKIAVEEFIEANILILFRFISNCFMLELIRPRLFDIQEQVFELIVEHFNNLGPNHKLAISTAILNYTITYQKNKNEDGINHCLSVLNEIIDPNNPQDTNFRLLVALANLICNNEDAKNMCNDLGIFDKIEPMKHSPTEKIQQLSSELIEKYKI